MDQDNFELQTTNESDYINYNNKSIKNKTIDHGTYLGGKSLGDY